VFAEKEVLCEIKVRGLRDGGWASPRENDGWEEWGCRPGRSNRIVGPTGRRFCFGTASSVYGVHDSGPAQPAGPNRLCFRPPPSSASLPACGAELKKFRPPQRRSALHSSHRVGGRIPCA